MSRLQLDLETYSSVDLPRAGVYAYAGSPDFQILLFAYAFDDAVVEVVDLASGEQIPNHVLNALLDPRTIKTAFNAAFERVCISEYLSVLYPARLTRYLDPAQWSCTAVLAATQGLPASLGQVGEALGLPDDERKLSTGRTLIRYFCLPCEPTTRNGGRGRNLPIHDPQRWALFKEYCARDVEAERAIRRVLDAHPMRVKEQELYALDQRINDRGVRVDLKMAAQAIKLDGEIKRALEAEAVALTGLDNPNSVKALKGWLESESEDGAAVASLSKKTLPDLIANASSDAIKRVLEIRGELSKTSITKYATMGRSAGADGRLRGMFQFYGARTGRWAGRLVNLQNLPQNHLRDLELARSLLATGDHTTLQMLFDAPDALSQLIRTALVPSEGCRFIVADFSAIEARVLAWLADEAWALDVFRGDGKIYEAAASQMFRVPIEAITKGSALRQKGKVAVLACGYQGGTNALIAMGALKMGITEDELPGIVQRWRKANSQIVSLWADYEAGAIEALATGQAQRFKHDVGFEPEADALYITLPSGRRLAYRNARIQKEAKYGRQGVVYTGVEGTSKKWTDLPLYGGLIVENVTQAVARDCLAEAMKRVDERGFHIVMHVHDEIILEEPYDNDIFEGDTLCAEDLAGVMSEPIKWAPSLPLCADAYECQFYRKD